MEKKSESKQNDLSKYKRKIPKNQIFVPEFLS